MLQAVDESGRTVLEWMAMRQTFLKAFDLHSAELSNEEKREVSEGTRLVGHLLQETDRNWSVGAAMVNGELVPAHLHVIHKEHWSLVGPVTAHDELSDETIELNANPLALPSEAEASVATPLADRFTEASLEPPRPYASQGTVESWDSFSPSALPTINKAKGDFRSNNNPAIQKRPGLWNRIAGFFGRS